MRHFLQTRLSRATSGGRFIPELDGLRAIAIVWVVLQHIQQHMGANLANASFGPRLLGETVFGVELFFIISAFILGLPFCVAARTGARPVGLKAYYLRRITRLEPPFLLHIVLVTAGWLLAGYAFIEVLPHALAGLFYVSNFVDGRFHPAALNPVTWSLEVEVQFYILAPLLAWVFRPIRPIFRFICILGGTLGVLLVRKMLPESFPVSLLDYFPYFAVGFVLADIYTTRWQQKLPTAAWATGVALMAWIAVFVLFQVHCPARTLVLAAVLGIAVWASFQSRAFRSVLGNIYVSTLGGMCYSIYLLHTPIIWLMEDYIPLYGQGETMLSLVYGGFIFGLPIVLISTLFFMCVERPCMKRGWYKGLGLTLKNRIKMR
jgi:peptidoglycan/LPS O-acetylase OafA/YrhL